MMATRGRKSQLENQATANLEDWEAPAYLTDEAKLEYERLVEVLHSRGTLIETDPTMLEMYALQYEVMKESHADIKDRGTTVINSKGTPVQNPSCLTFNSACMRLKGIINDLGLCPNNSRGTSQSEDDGSSKWEDLI